LVAKAAQASGFEDLAASAAAVATDAQDPHLLYRYAYDCTERGAAFLAVAPLTVVLAQQPDATAVRMELAAALQAEDRYSDAVRVLMHATAMERWIGRYLLVLNCLLAGDVDGARQWFTRLGRPEEPGQDRLAYGCTRMLARVQLLTGTTRLDAGHEAREPGAVLGARDLRGWHFVLNGGVITTLSAHGGEGMNGRYAFVQDSYAGCRRGLDRLALVLRAAERPVSDVGLLDDRPSRALGLALAAMLDLPTRELAAGDASDARPDRPATVVPVYSLSDLDPASAGLVAGTAGLLLAEHATCWTDPPAIAADVSTLLHQAVVAPWGPQLRLGSDGAATRSAPDARPARELAELILAATYGADESTHDPDDDLAAFITRIASRWGSGTVPRGRVWSPGPVSSSRFR
jgi:hypothetical protein